MATLTRGFNRIAAAQPVVLFIKQGDRLALSTCERSEYTQQWRDGEKLGKVSMLRNINCRETHRGHIDILESIGDKAYPNFEELYKHWMQVFSSELLTKKFYGELSDWYAWAVQVARFPNDLATTADDEKFNHESCIRLITRLIFVWFLKQKHLIPEEFFDEQYIKNHFIKEFDPHTRKTLFYDAEQSKYYRLILQNLFFAMLNRPIVPEGKDTPNNRRFRGDGQRGYLRSDYNVNNLMRYKSDFKEGGADKFLKMANTHVPFLNGGLFDCLDDKPKNLYYDGFSERKESLEQLYLPDWLFFGDEVGRSIDLSQWYGDTKKRSVSARGIIDILKKYNFTIEENTPLDQEVSLDPELLGKAFENLLGAYNPETKETARNQSGSFYTPREIVQYMVDETIVAYLKQACGGELESQYRSLLSYATEDTQLSKEQRLSIMHALYNCRVLDPACGSGAFPMGVLQQLVHILRQLDPANEMWKEYMIDLAIEQSRKAFTTDVEEERKTSLADIEEAFNQNINDPDYARKLYLIEHCIYGVDIQPIAVQISKLRFFISLVVDQKPTNDATNNFGIRPLPNLESKFVAANTLIPVKYNASLVESNEGVIKHKNTLKELNHKIFLAKRNIDKHNIKDKIKATRKALAQAIEDTGFVGHSEAEQLAGWDMFDQNTSCTYFDAEWMFGMKGGFDIVIGNPPYVQLQNNGGELAHMYEECGYSTFARTGDIYCLFYERGWQMLKKHGHLCYITSNKWMRAGYGDKTREFFANKTNPMLLIDFAGVKIFESATVDTNIFLFAKSDNQHETVCAVTNKQNKDSVKNLSDFVQQQNSICNFASSDSWVILSPIEQSIKKKIEAVGTPLKDWAINIYRGVLTGCNEAFIIDSNKRDEILANCQTEDERQRTVELIRPILRGRDIKRYGYDWANLWLIYIPWHFPYQFDESIQGASEKAERAFKEQYPAVYSHMLHYKEPLSKRNKAETGIRYEWYAMQRWGAKYWEDFLKPKIIYPNMTKYIPFVFDNRMYLTNQKCFIITGKYVAYLTAFFNSSLFKYCFRDSFPELQGGTRELSKIFFDKIPVYEVSDAQNQKFQDAVEDIQNEYTKQKAQRIDSMLFDLYNLTTEERKTIGFVEIV
ncbi:MAG: Eco57I restriction-modification methylase domain-containing protein [Prevotella sp.]|nr:Eco57I restriction-modification methylase domain-containing protein [Prevotella sp.]